MKSKFFIIYSFLFASCMKNPQDNAEVKLTKESRTARDYDGIVSFLNADEDDHCIATKIGSREYLTAADCVDDESNGNVTLSTRFSSGSRLELNNEVEISDTPLVDSTYTIDSVRIHPSWLNPNKDNSSRLNIAIIKVEQKNNWKQYGISRDEVGNVGSSLRRVGRSCKSGSQGRRDYTTSRTASLNELNEAISEETYEAMKDKWIFLPRSQILGHACEKGDVGGPVLITSHTTRKETRAGPTIQQEPKDSVVNNTRVESEEVLIGFFTGISGNTTEGATPVDKALRLDEASGVYDWIFQ